MWLGKGVHVVTPNKKVRSYRARTVAAWARWAAAT